MSAHRRRGGRVLKCKSPPRRAGIWSRRTHMKPLRAILRALSGPTDPVGSANSNPSRPDELSGVQLDQVTGGGGALGGVIGSLVNASKTRPSPDGSKGGGI